MSRAIWDWRFKGGGGTGQFWIGDLRVGVSRAIFDWRFTGGGVGGGGSRAILDWRFKGGGEQGNLGLEI